MVLNKSSTISKYNTNKIIAILLVLIGIYVFINISFVINDEKLMSIKEILEFNIKLYLISNAGLIDLKQGGSKILQKVTDDEIMINFYRRLSRKYGPYVKTYIITNDYNYFILEPELAKKILNDSPVLFSAGKVKEDFFNKIMPNNVGIAKCHDPKVVENIYDNQEYNESKCPWRKMRIFNENVLGTKEDNHFFKCIDKIVGQNIKKQLLSIDDFKEASNNIVCQSLFGSNGDNTCVFERIHYEFVNNKDVLKTDFYQEYKNLLHQSYQNAPKCSLNYLVDIYQNDNYNIIDDQIPHWTGPFRFIISYLVPNLLSIILSFQDIHNNLINEFSNKNFDINSKTSYLHYCVIEHIRMFNTININMQRTANKDMSYHGMNLKSGDQIFILFSSLLRNPDDFFDPDTFNPDRWSTKDIESQNMVFGIGPQKCPSINITPLYYKIIIHRLLTNFTYKNVVPKLKSKKIKYINSYDIKFH